MGVTIRNCAHQLGSKMLRCGAFFYASVSGLRRPFFGDLRASAVSVALALFAGAAFLDCPLISQGVPIVWPCVCGLASATF